MAGQLAARTHTSDDDLVVRVACALDKAELFHLELQPLQKKRKKAQVRSRAHRCSPAGVAQRSARSAAPQFFHLLRAPRS